jgi:uroporphyrin-III C-methyltransferase/precorrin-2 dehydrogenase/sirohydrochlorin ferrochelatase
MSGAAIMRRAVPWFSLLRDALSGLFPRTAARPSATAPALPERSRAGLPPDFGSARNGSVALVGAGPGSADLITLRGARLLAAADIVFYDRLVDPGLLDLAPASARRVHVGKAPGETPWPQDRINAALVAAARSGQRVVRLKCGDPGIFGRGAEEAAACAEAGIRCESVPGVTAASAAAAQIGEFLTLRNEIDTVVLTTGQLRAGAEPPDWSRHARPGTTLAIYMGVAVAGTLRQSFLDGGVPADAEVRVVHRAGFPDARSLRSTVARFPDDIDAAGLANPSIVLLRLPKIRTDAAAGKPADTGSRDNFARCVGPP